MAATFPKAPELSSYWRLLLKGECALEEAPARRLPERLFDPQSTDPSRFYTRRGGFIDREARFDPLRFGIMPTAARGAEPDQLMSLKACADALADAGYGPQAGRSFSSRVDVILGRGGYIGPGMTNLNLRVRTLEQLELTLTELGLLDEGARAQLRERFIERLDHFGPDTAIGLVPNLTAARVAQRLNFTGSAYTIDAACASALLSVERACESLRAGRSDLALAGGVHLVHDLTFWSVFTQLGALSRSHQLHPFCADADGLLIGEGLGVVALKRYSEARRDGDRIYALIEGIGSSSDGRGATLMSPSVEGQVLALERAWSGLGERSLGALEAHATATPVGDATELETVRRFFGDRDSAPPIALGTNKALIGHTMPASGIASLIKASLSLYHGVLPPTGSPLGASPHPQLMEGRLERLSEAQAWGEERPRRAAVNAFGFGGSNAHAVLCDPDLYRAAPHCAPRPRDLRLKRSAQRPLISHLSAPRALLCLAAESREALSQAIQTWAQRLSSRAQMRGDEGSWDHLVDASGQLTQSHSEGTGPQRVALLDPSPERLTQLLRALEGERAKRGRGGLWYQPAERQLRESASAAQLREGRPQVALLYPGVEAHFSPALDELCAQLSLPCPELYLESAEQTEGAPRLSQEALARRGLSVVRAGLTLTEALAQLGLKAQHIAGHSVGEWTGLVSAGYIDPEQVERFIEGLDPGGLQVPEVAFIAVGASRERVEALLGPQQGLYCSHANCPHQSVFCAPKSSAEALTKTLNEAQLIAQILPFESGFHAPYFQPFAEAITAHLRALKLSEPHTPLWSSTTCAPYPSPSPDPATLYELSDRHLTETVRFQALIERLYAEGVRVFIQVGVGSLSSFVSDTLRGSPHLALDAHSERLSAREQLLRLSAALFVEGFEMKPELLTPPGAPRERSIPLKLGVPLISLEGSAPSRPTALPQPTAPADVGAWRGAGTLPGRLAWSEANREWRASWPLSIEAMPYLRDHCFFRQPQGWPILRDRFPVVPMTLSMQWVMEAAQALIDEHGLRERVVGVEEVRASKWVEVAPPVNLELRAQISPPLHEPPAQSAGGASLRRVSLELIGHLKATVLLSAEAPAPPASPPQVLPEERRAPISAAQIYSERWMFHGPAYYGIDELSALSPKGLRGVLRVNATPGALLDNVGQLFGLWVMLTEREDRVVMPVSIDSLQLYGPPPSPGERLPCTVWIEALDKRSVTAHMCVWRAGRVWALIRGWKDWRFETSGALWGLMQYPERSLFARPLSPPQRSTAEEGLSFTLAEGVSASASSREFLVGRCLNQEEQAQYRARPLKAQREWLAGRIAAKDSARAQLWRAWRSAHPHEPLPPLYPIEVATERLPHGAAGFSGSGAGAALSLSIAHKGSVAVALSGPRSSKLGVDLEWVKPQAQSWREASFTSAERGLIEGLASTDEMSALCYCAAWCLKEALAKATGEGLGAPRRWRLEALSVHNEAELSWGQGRVEGQELSWWTLRTQVDGPTLVIAYAALRSV